MKPYRGLLIGFIVAGLVLANSPSYAKVRGRALLPDLVVMKIQFWPNYICVQSHILRRTVRVEIKNQGDGTAIWPQRGIFFTPEGYWPNGPWFQIWSQTEVKYSGYFLKELKPGHYAYWDTFLVVKEFYADKLWRTEYGVNVNPTKFIKESNYQNNAGGWISSQMNAICP
jgi:hypothetical protein